MSDKTPSTTTFPVAHLVSTRSPLSGLAAAGDLEAWLNEAADTAAEWWAHIEQSDGYVVGHRPAGGPWTFGGTAELNPSNVMDGRIFSATTELRLEWNSGALGAWRNTYEPESAPPQWVASHVTPLEVDALLVEKSAAAGAWRRDEKSGFTRVTQGNGQTVIVPIPFEGFSDGTRLRIRRHFAWDCRSGRVWIEVECLAGYIDRSN